jgi:glycine/D-amino acid oxidase-like deaminating enzyme
VPGARAPRTQNSELRTENFEPTPEPQNRRTPEPGSSPFDVAVVGAGYTGLSAARELAKRGASVVVFERETVGWGASSRNGGQILTGLKVDPATLLARYGEGRASRLFETSLEAIAYLERIVGDEGLDCEYERTGHLQAAAKPSHFDSFRKEQALLAATFHHTVELIPASEQRRELDSPAYFGLMLDERSSAINPARFVNGLAGAASRVGAVVAERTAVMSIGRKDGRWLVVTSRGAAAAREIFLATNGYTDGAAPWLRRRLVPIGSYVIATEPLGESVAAGLIPKRRMVFDSKHFLHYFRVTRDRRLLFGGRAEFGRPTPSAIARCAAILQRDMTAVFPVLGSASIEYAWNGHVAFTRDQMPHAGRLEGQYYAAGYSGHGVAMATFLGAQMGRRIAGEAVDIPLTDDRFPAIPLYRGNPWFLPLAGAYYKVADWLK